MLLKHIITGFLLTLMSTVGWGDGFSLKCVPATSTNPNFYYVWDFQKDDMEVESRIHTPEETTKMMPSRIWLWAEDRVVFGQNASPKSAISDSIGDVPHIAGSVFLPNQMQILQWSVIGDHPMLESDIHFQNRKLIPKL